MRFSPPSYVALALLPLLLTGCPQPASPFAGAGMDMFAPVSVHLHSLSRILAPVPPPTTTTATSAATRPTPAAPSLIEARVEPLDQFAEPTKTPGTITLQLFDQPPLTHKGDLIQSWTFSLNTPDENRDHWDRTLRMYLFKLPLVRSLPNRDHVLLTVTLTLPNEIPLTDELEMPVK